MTVAGRFLLLILPMFCCASAGAQQWDFGTWTKIGAKGELIKDLEFSVEQQVRLVDNSTSLDKTFTEIGIGYDLPKGLSIGVGYRLSFEPIKTGGMNMAHRYNIDLQYGKSFWKLKAKLRTRFQHEPSPSAFNERLKPDDSPMYVRLKLGVAYADLKDWTPGLEFEVYFPTNDPQGLPADKFRYRVFLDYEVSKRHEVGAFYMLQTDYKGKTPEFDSILGVNYSYNWKRPNKKKKKDKE